MASKTYVARREFSILDHPFYPGDVVPMADLQRVPGDWKKLERTGLIVEQENDNA